MSTHDGYLKEFPFIRVDSFTSIPNPSTSLHPLYYFLTHAHTDHLNGLNSPNFRGIVYMTPVTKMIVSNTMESSERVRWQEFGGDRLKKPKKKFDNLFKVKPGAGSTGKGRGIEQIREINFNQPLKLRGVNEGDWVKVVAVDANHCPGSCMFLFEGVVNGSFRSCLVTGDLRAEPWYLSSLLHNPLLAPYTTTSSTSPPVRELDCIYLDTSNVLLNEELGTKEQAIDDLIELIKKYPRDTKFFLNCWTWGYEDLLKGIYKAFGNESIHLDWYKHRIFTAPSIQNSDPLLSTLGSLSPFLLHQEGSLPPPPYPQQSNEYDPSPSLHICDHTAPLAPSPNIPKSGRKKELRFHACERYWKCDQVWQDGKGSFTWSQEYLDLRRQQQRGRPSDSNVPREEIKKLVRPGSGEYLRKDGSVGIKRRGEQGEEQEGEEEGRVVYVNPVEMMEWKWEEYKSLTGTKIEKARKGDGVDHQFPKNLLVPLARHSTLPELQRFTSIFKPRTLYPLTISTSDPRQPARDYLSMSTLFSNCLAEGGETRLKREAKEFVKNWKKLNRGVVVTSSPENVEEEEEDGIRWLGEGSWEREVRKKGLNVEGGKEVVEEVLKWANNLESKPVIENGGVRDMEHDEQVEAVAEPEQPVVRGNRKLTYGGNLSQTSADSPRRLVAGPNSSSIDLLPSVLPPRPGRQPATPTKRPSHPSTLNSLGRTLRKSVTFAPSPTTTATTRSPELGLHSGVPSSAVVVPMKRTRSLPIPQPSPITYHKIPSASSSSTSTVPPRTNSENAPPPPPSSSATHSSPVSETSKRQKPTIRTEEERRQERLVLALQRTLQGKIGPDGELIPFTEKERETLKRRERRLREETKREKGKATTRDRDRDQVGVLQTSPGLKQFGTVGSSY